MWCRYFTVMFVVFRKRLTILASSITHNRLHFFLVKGASDLFQVLFFVKKIRFVVKFCLYCGIIKNQTKWITNLLKNNYR